MIYLSRCYLASIVIALCLSTSTLGQVNNSKKFHAVPRSLRERLVERFNLYVEYERTRQHEKLFDLLSEAYISNQHLTRQSYLQYRLKEPMVEFKLNAVIRRPIAGSVNVYEIHGTAEFQHGNKIAAEDRLLEARFQGNDWYFSDWLIQIND